MYALAHDSIVRGGQTRTQSLRLVVSHSTRPPPLPSPPRAAFQRSCQVVRGGEGGARTKRNEGFHTLYMIGHYGLRAREARPKERESRGLRRGPDLAQIPLFTIMIQTLMPGHRSKAVCDGHGKHQSGFSLRLFPPKRRSWTVTSRTATPCNWAHGATLHFLTLTSRTQRNKNS